MSTVEKTKTLEIVTMGAWGEPSTAIGRPFRTVPWRVFQMNTNTATCFSSETCVDAMRWLKRYKDSYNITSDLRYKYRACTFVFFKQDNKPFSFIIGGDGRVYEVRGWHFPPHLPNEYKKSTYHALLVGFFGKFTAENEIPDLMNEAFHSLLKYGYTNGHLLFNHEIVDILKRPPYSKGDMPLRF